MYLKRVWRVLAYHKIIMKSHPAQPLSVGREVQSRVSRYVGLRQYRTCRAESACLESALSMQRLGVAVTYLYPHTEGGGHVE